MSSPSTQHTEAQKPENSTAAAATATNNAAAPRKRRRRAPATGASEDCFACRKRQIKCDRRRPYCGQCIELGKDCTGYRTTLTWGVGVASRGKLRGMSLPVPKSPTQTSSTARQETKSQSSTASSSTATPTTQGPTKLETRHSVDFGVTSPISPTSPTLYSGPHEYNYFGPTSPIPIPSPTTGAPMGFGGPGYGDHVDAFHPHTSKLKRPHLQPGFHLQRLHTSLHAPYDETGLSTSSASLGTHSDSDFPSPGEYPPTPHDEFPFGDSSLPQFQPINWHDQTPMSSIDNFQFYDIPRTLPMADDLSSSISSDQSVQDLSDASSTQQNMGPPTFPEIFIEGEMASSANGFSQSGFSYLPTEGMSSNGSGPLSSDELALTTAIPQSLILASPPSPRMQYLLDYYDRFICRVLVAFDEPSSNPYRMHVMHLAMRDEGLQNAIAALATNNMRMRNALQGRRVSTAENDGYLPEHSFQAISTQELREMHGEPTDEEKHYKAASVTLLNRKLARPGGAQDDSVLATLLILCLFHVCDSGFAKFKTQLAGVQKLLSMRDRSVQSQFIGWIELFFTWFDVMTSAVNDRETEVQGESLDMTNLTANLGALEHLSGCEGRLFKLIARLGRLNLMSQNRAVREQDTTPRASPKPRRPTRDFYSFNFDHYDGNGWGGLINERVSPTTPPADHRPTAFWIEWNDIRTRLQAWQMDPPAGGPVSSADDGNQTDASSLRHMSESFRYAALLYTERLAEPTPPSSAFNFQALVAQGLHHISQIGVASCMNKFLLWPLFIIGTECVDPGHRATVRQRCIEIQRESGFFNNLSGLEVLEKVWQDYDEGESNGGAGHGPFGAQQQAFRWRRAMDRVDGEYIVI
ncbi:uncharacterized protein EI97DRAFT_469676 [Westerdykella ornata]|uniref:Zn(2)-C6 fungal-type domain-containing protein n=1 Tax=Westerdykella ornata TaxID=318751 RepID=A0A6A6JAS3_WESOR|nr:uncharacterized protein EI97DRAFT_469676 [Westerdykella ornata]KAF2273273.1 hypothetical protein EI97DRAFT_469676 [Westerdykella ornata]